MDHWTADEVLLREKGDDSALKDMVVEGSGKGVGGRRRRDELRREREKRKPKKVVGSQPLSVIFMLIMARETQWF